MKSSKLFITGCDYNTEWMLPWFVENFKKHNPETELVIYDFGMRGGLYPEMRKSLRGNQDKGWFKKPAAMLNASQLADNVCWIDTDCEIVGNINGIWEYLEPNKLLMAEDLPWSKRRGEKWHNSGVVAFQSTPKILSEWAAEVSVNPIQGDQEVLHMMVKDGLKRMIHITDLPRKYNVLRIDHLDKTVPKDPKIFHWTGQKGKDKIRSLMNG
jgi:hypothetical protein